MRGKWFFYVKAIHFFNSWVSIDFHGATAIRAKAYQPTVDFTSIILSWLLNIDNYYNDYKNKKYAQSSILSHIASKPDREKLLE